MRGTILGYGGVLVVIGVAGYLAGGAAHGTALIPAILGAVALIAGWLAAGRPRLAGIIAAVVAVVALIGTLGALPLLPLAIAGDPEVNALAVYARAATAVASIALLARLALAWLRPARTPLAPRR